MKMKAQLMTVLTVDHYYIENICILKINENMINARDRQINVISSTVFANLNIEKDPFKNFSVTF